MSKLRGEENWGAMEEEEDHYPSYISHYIPWRLSVKEKRENIAEWMDEKGELEKSKKRRADSAEREVKTRLYLEILFVLTVLE